MEQQHRNLLRTVFVTLLLSLPLVLVPVAGPVFAAWIGGRRAGPTAVASGIIVGLLWGLALWLASAREVSLGGTQVSLGPLLLLVPAVVGSFVAGGLFACGGRKAVTIGVVLGTAGVVWSGGQLQPVVGLARQLRPEPATETAAGTASCSEHLAKLYNAAMLYADSWDGTLPPADRWEEALKETLSDPAYLRCPGAGASRNGYAMNEALSSKQVAKIAHPDKTPLFYDSILPGPNAHDDAASLPRPGRHDGKNNIVYADGHTASVAP